MASGNASESLSLQLVPGRQSSGINLGVVSVVGSFLADGSLSGRWSSTIGTQGIFNGTRSRTTATLAEMPKQNSVFIVHGHDEGAKHSVARFLQAIGVKPVILQEQISSGKTVIEKFEDFANRAGFAIVLMTPDDMGYPNGKPTEIKGRPRQNVVLELGFFASKLGRDRTLVLMRGDVEMPSDVMGLVYEPMDTADGWKMRVAKELKAAGFDVNLNDAI